MAMIGDIEVKLGLDVTDFQQGLQNAESKMNNVGKSMSRIGKNLTKKVSAPLIGVGVASVKVGADFQKSMAKVQAVTGASAKDFTALEDKARDLGATTKYSAGEVADGMGFLGMAGFETNQILDSTEDVLNLASISGLDLASTADIASNMISGMGMEAGDLNKLVDTMAYTMSNSNVDVGMLGESFKYVAPIASDLGVDVDELSGAIGFLGDAGIQGGQAGTQLANGLTRLASPTNTAQELMEDLGIEAFNAEGELKSLPEVLEELDNGFSDLNPQEKTEVMKELFGQQNIKGWNALLARGGDELREYADDIEHASGAGQEMADIMNDTMYGSLNELKSALSEVGISIFEILEPAIETIIEKLTDFVKWLGELDESTLKWVTAISAVTAAIPVLIGVIGAILQTFSFLIGVVKKVVSIFRIVRTVMSFASILPLITNPVGIIVAVLAGLVAAGVAIWKNWDVIKEKAIEIWNSIASFFSETWATISEGIMNFLTPIGQWFADTWNTLMDGISDFVSSIVEWFSETWNSIKEGISNFLSPIVGWFSDTWNNILDTTQSIFTSIIDFIVSWGQKLYEASGLEPFVDFAINMWEVMKDTISILQDTLVALVKLGFKMIKKGVTTALTATKNVFTKIWNAIVDFLSPILSSIKSAVTTAFNAVKSVVSSITQSVKSVVTTAWNGIKSVTSTVFNSVKSVVTSIFNSVKSVVTSVASNIWNAISDAWNNVLSTTSDIFNSVWDTVTDVFNSIWDTISGIVSDVVSTVTDNFNSAKDAIIDPISNAKDTVLGIIDSIKDAFSAMKITIPKPKLPKVSVSKGSKSIAGISIPYPKFSISWNAKGAIFNQATVLGGGQGVGEAGAEAVLPVEHKRYMQPFASAIASNLNDNKDNTAKGNVSNTFNISSLVVREEADVERIAKELEKIQRKEQRAKGII